MKENTENLCKVCHQGKCVTNDCLSVIDNWNEIDPNKIDSFPLEGQAVWATTYIGWKWSLLWRNELANSYTFWIEKDSELAPIGAGAMFR